MFGVIVLLVCLVLAKRRILCRLLEVFTLTMLPGPVTEEHNHSMRLTHPNFTVGIVFFGLKALPFLHQTKPNITVAKQLHFHLIQPQDWWPEAWVLYQCLLSNTSRLLDAFLLVEEFLWVDVHEDLACAVCAGLSDLKPLFIILLRFSWKACIEIQGLFKASGDNFRSRRGDTCAFFPQCGIFVLLYYALNCGNRHSEKTFIDLFKMHMLRSSLSCLVFTVLTWTEDKLHWLNFIYTSEAESWAMAFLSFVSIEDCKHVCNV